MVGAQPLGKEPPWERPLRQGTQRRQRRQRRLAKPAVAGLGERVLQHHVENAAVLVHGVFPGFVDYEAGGVLKVVPVVVVPV